MFPSAIEVRILLWTPPGFHGMFLFFSLVARISEAEKPKQSTEKWRKSTEKRVPFWLFVIFCCFYKIWYYAWVVATSIFFPMFNPILGEMIHLTSIGWQKHPPPTRCSWAVLLACAMACMSELKLVGVIWNPAASGNDLDLSFGFVSIPMNGRCDGGR